MARYIPPKDVSHKLDKGNYQGTAEDLKTDVDNIVNIPQGLFIVEEPQRGSDNFSDSKKIFDFVKKEISRGNLFENPKFRHPLSVTINNTSNQDVSLFGGGFGINNLSFNYPDAEKTSCLRIKSESADLQTRKIALSSSFLKRIGFETGDKIKIGFYAKCDGADGSYTKTIYNYDDSNTPHTFDINNPNWNWIEFPELTITNIDISKEIYLSFRYLQPNEYFKITDLVIKNTTKSVWNGFEKSQDWENRKEIFGTNLNTFSRRIDKDNFLYNDLSEHNGNEYTKEIFDLVGAIIQGKALRYANVSNENLRLNLYLRQLNLTPKPYDRKIKIGFYLKTNNANTIVRFFPFNETVQDNHSVNQIEINTETWIESLSFVIPANQTNIVDGVNERIIIDSTSPGMNVFEVYGLTVSEIENDYEFVCTDTSEEFHTKQRLNPFFGKKLCSYGDSITASNNWQPALNQYLGTTHYLRGIGGTTIANTNQTAYVDAKGRYLDRPVLLGGNGVPQGTNGIDYFTINSCFVDQDRVNTIPLDTEILLIMGGTNDENSNVPIGNINDNIDTSFYGAWNIMLSRIYARVPNVEIYLLTPIYGVGGDNLPQYREAINSIANKFSLSVIETHKCGINQFNGATSIPDGTHPSLIGANKITEYLKTKF